jgi:serine/threonine protein kinase
MRGSNMALQAGTRLGPYEVVSLLGAGGMGEVYRARDTRLGREVAIKVLPADRVSDADRRRRFVQEAQAASALTTRTSLRSTRSSRPTGTTSS